MAISRVSLGVPGRHALWISEDADGSLTLVNSEIADVGNASKTFKIVKE